MNKHSAKTKKNTKRKKLIWYSICGGAEKEKHSAETDKIGAKNDKIEVPKKSAETDGSGEIKAIG